MPGGVHFMRTRNHGEVRHKRRSHRASDANSVAATIAAIPRTGAGLGRTI